jgi:hypothetical protein
MTTSSFELKANGRVVTQVVRPSVRPATRGVRVV